MENRYKTKDLAEAAALIVKGIQLINIERKGDICWFVFNDYETCKSLSYNYHFGSLALNARDYFESLKRLKSRIFSI